MQIVLHAGAHFTDEERLLKSLLKNKSVLTARGVAVPGPGKYRSLIRDTLIAMRTDPPAEDAREVLIDAILDDETADRLVMSNSNFFCAPRGAIRNGQMYPNATMRLAQMQQVFAQDQIELFIGMRNPVSLLPALFEKSQKETFAEFIQGTDPAEVRWSEMVGRISQAVPNVSMTVWCNEDTPLIWEQIIREMAGVEPTFEVDGSFDLIADIMTPEGLMRLRNYLNEKPDLTEVQKRRVVSAFLEKYAIEEQIEEELDIPGITESMVDQITDLYDEDMLEVARIPGVTFLSP